MKVLLIDDDKNFGKILRWLLEKTDSDLELIQVYSCKEGLKILRDGWEIVLLDFKMVELSGLECLKEIREAAEHLPVVLMTGYTEEEVMEQCMEGGADDFVSKGLVETLLPHVMWSAISRRKARLKIQADVRDRKAELDKIQETLKEGE